MITPIDMPNRVKQVFKRISKRHAKYHASQYMIWRVKWVSNWNYQWQANQWSISCANHQASQYDKGNYNQRYFQCAKVIAKFQSKKHVNGIPKWISNRCSHHHVNWKSKFKSQIPSKLRHICSQASETRGTNKSAEIYNNFIFHIISSSSSRKRATWTRLWGSMVISHIGVRETRALVSSTKQESTIKRNTSKRRKLYLIKFQCNWTRSYSNPSSQYLVIICM